MKTGQRWRRGLQPRNTKGTSGPWHWAETGRAPPSEPSEEATRATPCRRWPPTWKGTDLGRFTPVGPWACLTQPGNLLHLVRVSDTGRTTHREGWINSREQWRT